jgi:hypothetical protein
LDNLKTNATAIERRRFRRMSLQVPIFVRGKDVHGAEYLELVKTVDIGPSGALIIISRSLHLGDSVSLTIPAPDFPSSVLVPSASPRIQAHVRRIQPDGESQLIGVEFSKTLD